MRIPIASTPTAHCKVLMSLVIAAPEALAAAGRGWRVRELAGGNGGHGGTGGLLVSNAGVGGEGGVATSTAASAEPAATPSCWETAASAGRRAARPPDSPARRYRRPGRRVFRQRRHRRPGRHRAGRRRDQSPIGLALNGIGSLAGRRTASCELLGNQGDIRRMATDPSTVDLHRSARPRGRRCAKRGASWVKPVPTVHTCN
ncbi:hypothetical protein BZL30_3349 [Mycobacterium kansasii]|uniref:Uncharacterized protein n=1 Tax=Mycobacterium kansasii TaxID=1768 RepID=A0A1V3XAH4_MYCKA|nr:hypothetical protein BZL30_3349 [Mycobacterium kansasii]